ncbi:TPM domain-containing protein [Inquilinus limosus]|uniref:TPM domain-containing protein n=1 Tax=Inquilinus limosus TaxID=171674 RepID=A0A211ZIW6_9PROT|nr:TPM domain-containing protein [Inquilinus limosus]OWJ65193.1 hypothetical protein BWR60_20625 [Inquilinus limosus]
MSSGGWAPAPGLRLRAAVLVLAWLYLLCPLAMAQEIPDLRARVTDAAGVLTQADAAGLEARLATLERTKGAQLAILLVKSTAPLDIDAYAGRVFERWKLGRKGVDDGVLVVVATSDRAVRIEVGRGLEGAIPDVTAGRINREQMLPRFRDGDFAGGLAAAVAAIEARIAGEDLPPPERPHGPVPPWWFVILIAAMAGLILPPLLSIFLLIPLSLVDQPLPAKGEAEAAKASRSESDRPRRTSWLFAVNLLLGAAAGYWVLGSVFHLTGLRLGIALAIYLVLGAGALLWIRFLAPEPKAGPAGGAAGTPADTPSSDTSDFGSGSSGTDFSGGGGSSAGGGASDRW